MEWWQILILRIVAALVIIGAGSGLGYLIGRVPGLIVGAMVGLVGQFLIFREADKVAYW